ncbi:hypothetical protein [Microbacterium binotii]|uniref:hypothetical protein n=1 Tax=Microbacterium binotii TaxID=462710 RepID=UPI001F4377E4|nr:hypothetical protein [Microbacterium binotii]UIN29268.1 hypothetical protein LXM64_08765 [Microbacterium binotii]
MTARHGGDAEAAASVADRNLEYGLLVFYGMRELADGLSDDAAALSRRMEREAKRSARRRFGAATSFGAPLAGLQFLLVLVGATVLISVNMLSVQFDREHRLERLQTDAASLTVAGVVVLELVAMLAAVGQRVVDRSVSTVAARAALLYALGAGAVIVAYANGLTAPATVVAVVVVAVLSAGVAVWFAAHRRRRPAAAAEVDAAWSWAVAQQLPSFEHERALLRERVARAFAARTDTGSIIADRNSIHTPAIADALPGEAIIALQSSLWLTTGRHARESRKTV